MPAHRRTQTRRLRSSGTIHFPTPNLVNPKTPDRETSTTQSAPATPTRPLQGDPARTEPSTPLSPTVRPSGHHRALRREPSALFCHAVFHYDRVENDLQPWHWPVTESGERVAPSALLEYRRSHEFRGPSCLCASLDPNECAYTEASIFLAESGPSAGKYVAACATGLCRYWVCMENLYSQRGLLVRRFPKRDTTNGSVPVPPKSQFLAVRELQDTEKHIGSVLDLVIRESYGPDKMETGSNPSQQGLALPPASNTPAPITEGISGFTPVILPESYFGLLLQLDDISEPGIEEELFRELFTKCYGCRKYMTKRTAMFHHCE